MKPDVKRPHQYTPRFILGGNHLIVITKKSQALITYFTFVNLIIIMIMYKSSTSLYKICRNESVF